MQGTTSCTETGPRPNFMSITVDLTVYLKVDLTVDLKVAVQMSEESRTMQRSEALRRDGRL